MGLQRQVVSKHHVPSQELLFAFSCLPLVFCRYTEPLPPPAYTEPPPPVYPEPPVESSYARATAPEYNPDIGQTNVGGYGTNKDPYCHKVEKVVFENQCEPYTEKTCWTQNKEH